MSDTTFDTARSDIERRPSTDDLPGVRSEPYAAGNGLPLFLEPIDRRLAGEAGAVDEWFEANRELIDALTTQVGAVVLRGFAIHDTATFNRLVRHYGASDFGYAAGATPRNKIEGRAYEATRLPANLKLYLHQEMAYLPVFPDRLAFYCHEAPESGGETIICDMRKVTADLDRALFDRVSARGVRYNRNFRDPDRSFGSPERTAMHRSWPEAFGTTDPRAAEAQCEAMGLEYEWVLGGMSVGYTARGLIDHPTTGELVWFNQIATQTLTAQNVGEELARYFQEAYTDHPLPYDTTYGDGSPIDPDDVLSIYPVLDRHTVEFPWRRGDVMLLDNYYTAHGRNPFIGHRDVQVALLD